MDALDTSFGNGSSVVGESSIVIAQQPQSITRLVGEKASFRVEVQYLGTDGKAPEIHYLWERRLRGEEIWTALPELDSATYEILLLNCELNRAQFRCRASVPGLEVVSEEAELTVSCDCDPPMLMRLEVASSLDELILEFDDALSPAKALSLEAYSIEGLTPHEVTLRSGIAPYISSVVVLSTSPMTPGATYTLLATNFASSGFPGCEKESYVYETFEVPVLLRGILRREIFSNVEGRFLSDLTNHFYFPHQPDEMDYVRSFETSRNIGDEFGTRLSGFLLPPVSGSYIFYLASGEQGALFVSQDETSVNKRQIAFEPEAKESRIWDPCPPCGNIKPNISEPIPLEAGRRYYIEAIMKEWMFHDNLAVAWQLAGDPMPRNGFDVLPATYLATAVDRAESLSLTTQPQDYIQTVNCRASFSVAAEAQPREAPLSYQWQRDGVDIPGANEFFYQTSYLNVIDDGSSYRCVVSAGGHRLVSNGATLQISGDIVPPRLMTVLPYGDRTLFLEFNARISPDTLVLEFEPTLAVEAISSYPGDDLILQVTTSTMSPGGDYNLTFPLIVDLNGNIASEPTEVSFRAPVSDGMLGLRIWTHDRLGLVDWPVGGILLQVADEPMGPWVDLNEATSPYVFRTRPHPCQIDPRFPQRFFRLRF